MTVSTVNSYRYYRSPLDPQQFGTIIGLQTPPPLSRMPYRHAKGLNKQGFFREMLDTRKEIRRIRSHRRGMEQPGSSSGS